MGNQKTMGTSAVVPHGDDSGIVRLRHRILRAGGWAGGGFVLDKVIAAVQLAVVARILSPADFGVMAASAAVLLAMLTISELGLDSAIIAKNDVSDEDLAVAWTLSVGRALIIAVGVWVSADMMAEFMRMPLLATLLRVHAWALILQAVQSPALVLMVKTLDLRRRVTLDVIRRAVEAAVTLTLAILYRNVWALVIGQLAALAVGGMLSFWMAPFRPRWSLKGPALSYFFHYGKHLNVTTLCAFGVMTGGELVIGRLQGPEALGFYQVALALPLLIGARATALMQQISVPTYATLQQDRLGVARVFDLQMGLVGVVYIPLGVVIAALAPVMVPLLFGPQWLSIIDALRILCLYTVCAGYASVMASLHYGVNRPELQMKSWAGQFLFYAVAIVPLTMRFGITGAAAALTGSYVVGILLQSIGTRTLIGQAVDATFWSIGRASVLACSLAGLLVLLAGTAAVPTTSGMVVAACVVGFGTYGWYLWSVEVPRLKVLWDYS